MTNDMKDWDEGYFKFQFLIGKIMTDEGKMDLSDHLMFQFLIGKIMTLTVGILMKCYLPVSIPHR